jgi:uncharacterized protein (TIGR02996 family)
VIGVGSSPTEEVTMPPRPKPALPDPAAVLPGEADILANVLDDLSDDNAKLVYADWLEERDDPRGPLLRKFVAAFRAGKKLPPVKSAPKPWRDVVGLTLMSKLRDTDLAPKADAVLAAVRPAITFGFAKAAEGSIPVGASKYGGRPDMPAKAKWPEDYGEPLSFLAQFNLADLQASPVARELPAAGLLSLFCLYDYGTDFTKRNWRLLHFPDASGLVRREQHPDLPEEHVAAAGRLSFAEGPTLPDVDSPWGKELLRAVRPADPGGEAYRHLYIDDTTVGGADMLLGHPHPFEGDVLGKKSVRHLLTTGGSDWWPDGNMMYVTIPEADLKAGRFDRAKATLQCF